MTSKTASPILNSTLLVGKTISHYQILLKIRQTDLFTFYKTYDTTLEKKVTLQVFSSQFNYTQDFVRRLVKHVESTQNLSHPNIASILEVAQIDNLLYVALDFVPKISFSQRYNQRLEATSAASILTPITEALVICHQAGIIHGNLNPDCMFIDETNQIKLFDFGIEQLTITYLSKLTPGNWLGFVKHAYWAPEQILQQVSSKQTDTYALGVIFAELISGKRAFAGSSILESLFQRVQAQMDVFPIAKDAIPRPARKMIQKATSFLPQKRYQSALTFLEALKMVEKGHWKKAEQERKQSRMNSNKWWLPAGSLLLASLLIGILLVKRVNPAPANQNNISVTGTSFPTQTQISQSTPTPATLLSVDETTAAESTATSQSAPEKLPVIFNHTLPDIREAIQPANVQQIVPLARWGLGSVRQFAWSPDGQQFVLGTSIGAFSFDPAFNFQQHYDTGAWVNAVAYFPDGQTMITGTRDGLIQIWKSGEESFSPLGSHIQAINALAISPDSTMVASGSEDNSVKIWDVKNKQVLQLLKGHLKGIRAVSFSPDGQLVASGSADSTIKIWNVSSGQQQMNMVLAGPVTSLAFSPDGNILAAVGDEPLVKLWNMTNGQSLPAVRGMTSPIKSISFNPDNKRIAVGELNGTISVWDIQSLKLVWTEKNEPMSLSLGTGFDYVHDVKFSPDGSLLASASWDNTVILFDAESGKEIRRMDKFGEFNQALSFSPNSQMLASQSMEGITKIWNIQKGEVRFLVPGYLVQGQSFSNNNQFLALKANPTTVNVFNTTSGKLVYSLGGHSNIFSITFSPDDLFLAAGSGKDFKVWSILTGLEVITTPTVNAGCTFTQSVAGTSLAKGISLNYLTFTDPGPLCKTSKPPWSKSLDINDDMVVFGGTSMVKVENYGTNPGLTSIMGYDALCVDSSDNKSMILAGVSDNTIRIWNLENQEEIFNVPVHDSPPTAVRFSANNQMIATTALDGTIRIWGIH